MTILVTGGNGFVGKHLVKYLSDKGNDVYISSRKNYDNEKIIKINYNDLDDIKNTLLHYKFDKIFHLAAQSSVHISWERPFNTMQDNINSTLNLLRACQVLKNVKIIVAGTSEVYKTTTERMTEESAIEPRSPYTISKLTIDYFTRLIAKELNLNITLLRLFNHAGPGQSIEFSLSSFAHQLAKIKLKQQENIIKVGDLTVRRDFTDISDVICSYELVSNNVEYGEVYNVCSGQPHKIDDLLSILINISKLYVKVEVDSERLRPHDVPYYYGSYDKILTKHGWRPEVPIQVTLENLYNYWLKTLESSLNKTTSTIEN